MERPTEPGTQRLTFDRNMREHQPLEISAHQNRRVLGFLQIICFSVPAFLFLVMGVFLVEKARYTGNVSYDDMLSFVIAIGSVGLVFGALSLWITIVLVKIVAIVSVNTQGITIGKFSSSSNPGISWPEIASIYVTERTVNNQSQRLLCILPKNLEQFLARCGWVMGDDRMNRRLGDSTMPCNLCGRPWLAASHCR